MSNRYTYDAADIYDEDRSLRDTDIVDRLNEQDETITRLQAQRDALLGAAHDAHTLLWHYDLVRQPNGVIWGPVEMLRAEQIESLWHAITLTQPELIIKESTP